VKDPNGGVVPRAKVTVKHGATNAETQTQTDETGFYRELNLLPGDHIVSVEAEGFRGASTTPQTLTVAQELRVDLNLEIGQVTEIVEVQGTVRKVNTEDPQLGFAITAVAALAVISGAAGRNSLNLAGLMPGVSMTPPAGAPTNYIGPFAVNGQRTQANNYLLDGVDSNDLAINIPDSLGQISPNALAEFRIVTGAMKAEYGRNGGAVVEAVTRSGGNAWHGIAEEVFRNSKLNATPFFQNVTAGGANGLFSNGLARKPQWNTNDFDADLPGAHQKEQDLFLRQLFGIPAAAGSDQQRDGFYGRGTSSNSDLWNRRGEGHTPIGSSSLKRQHLVQLSHQFAQPRSGTRAHRSPFQRTE
jgi:hypothetical protein